MRIAHGALPAIRLVVLVLFVAVCSVIFGYLWLNSGGKLPLLSRSGYQVSFIAPKTANLVYNGDVMIAGVPVGDVEKIDVHGGEAEVTIQLNEQHPLHEGVTFQLRNKTLVEETFVEIVDGHGAKIPSGTKLPAESVKPAVKLNDVLASLDGDTRAALAGSVRSLGAGTEGTRQDLSAALSGLGDLGRQGKDALGALAAQSDDLRQLAANSATLLAALDSRQGQIAQMVQNANELSKATAGGAGQIEDVVRKLPTLLDTAKQASAGLNRLSGSLAPVARDLNAAAPALSTALAELPATAADLRGLLPSLDGVLNKSPGTLDRVPQLSTDLRQLIPNARVAMSDVNPMLAYLRPYGPEIAAYFINWGDSVTNGDANGKYWNVYPILNEYSIKGLPIKNSTLGPLNKHNPYPAPGTLNDPGPQDRPYPRLEREGN
ncbi:MlaD family protein [Thermocrispum municipale]|jgi:phospholipid/cholesterol/gamma-HCH transport system substrate-binding protein|uniref:MlaD family protein n=1 Tax=Thermocrispum municipale TaxID=37926 RepID=UPI00048C978A|nr:MlaD family protein [Thermocrispum municipale]